VAQGKQAGQAFLEDFYRAYWQPVFAYFHFHGHPPDRAEDLMQGFFADKAMSPGFFERIDREQGLRPYLLTALRHYHIDALRQRASRDRRRREFIDQTRIDSICSADHPSPEEAFDREWVAAILQRALVITQSHFFEVKKAHWILFEAAKHLTLGTSSRGPTQRQRAGELGIKNPGSAVQVVWEYLTTTGLREAVRDTLADGADLEAELRHIRSMLGS